MNKEKVYLQGREVVTPHYLDKAINNASKSQDTFNAHNIYILKTNLKAGLSCGGLEDKRLDETNCEGATELMNYLNARFDSGVPNIPVMIILTTLDNQLLFLGSRLNITVSEFSSYCFTATDGSGNKSALLIRYNKGNSYLYIEEYKDAYYVPYSYVKNNVSKVNTTAYEVTGDYNPAHKKYVDDAVANLKSFEEMGIYKIKLSDEWPNGACFITKDVEGATELFAKINEIQNSDAANKYYPFLIIVEFNGTSVLFRSLANSYNKFRFISDTFSYNDSGGTGSTSTDSPMRLYMYIRPGTGTSYNPDIQLQIDQYNSFHVTANNTKYYDVTDNYNPAHKKYVDDTITARTEALYFDGDSNQWDALTQAEKDAFLVAIVEPPMPTTYNLNIEFKNSTGTNNLSNEYISGVTITKDGELYAQLLDAGDPNITGIAVEPGTYVVTVDYINVLPDSMEPEINTELLESKTVTVESSDVTVTFNCTTL